jgi:hypothetical protein
MSDANKLNEGEPFLASQTRILEMVESGARFRDILLIKRWARPIQP